MSIEIPAPVVHGAVSVGDALPELAVDVTPTLVVLGAVASRDWRPMHHDYKCATERNGVADIFLNTPNQAAWFERYVTDWTGPLGRIGRMTFRMRDSVFPGDRMVFSAVVTATEVDPAGCGWVTLDVTLTASSAERPERTTSTCTARVAVPLSTDDNPWRRRGDAWRP